MTMNALGTCWLACPALMLASALAPRAAAAPQSDVGWCAERFPNTLFAPSSSLFVDLLELVDVNGDGRLDVFFNGVTYGVRMALAQPASGHQPAQTVTELETAARLTAGDIDGDGNVDVVERPTTGGRARIYLGDGKGAFVFLAAHSMSSGAIPAASDIALGDVNGDGALDLLAADLTTRELGVRLNQGGALFSPLSVTALPGFPGQLELGDVDGDGDLDVVGHGIGQTGRIGVLFGDGLGNFGGALATSISAFPFVLRDIDLDGRLDIAVATAAPGAGALRVLLGQGSGAFTLASTSPIGAPLAHLALGDFDGDGKLDAALAEESGATWVLDGLGAGTFAAPRRLPVAGTRGGLRAADIDGDGYEDLALLSNSTMGVLYGSPIEPLALPASVGLGAVASALAAADFDGDGHQDVLVARSGGGGELVELLRGDGAGSLAASSTGALPARAQALVLGDHDGDGRLDVLCATPSASSVMWLRGLPGGALGNAVVSAGGQAFAHLASGDLDGDGRDDALSYASGQASVTWLRGGALGPQLAAALVLPANVVAVTCGDVNADGFDDALISSADQGLHWFAGSPTGPLAPQSYYNGHDLLALATGRIDADAFDDLLIASGDSTLIVRYGSLSGPGLENALQPQGAYESATLRDVDGDGRTDALFELVVGDGRKLGVRRGAPTGFLEASFYALAESAGPAAFADLDGDGRDEALVLETQAASLRIARSRKGDRISSYCAGGVSLGGCTGALHAVGTPSANAGSGLMLTTDQLDAQRSALTFLSVSFPLVQPWASGSSSSLCLTPPIVRCPVQFSGGAAGGCTGAISVDANASIAPTSWHAGQIAFAQTWVRDPLAPKHSQLSNAIAFELGL